MALVTVDLVENRAVGRFAAVRVIGCGWHAGGPGAVP
jgi:hypothetical protein